MRSATLLATVERESAEVTSWPERIGLTVGLLALIGVVCWLMWRGWRRRAARQSGLSAMTEPPKDLGHAVLEPLEGRYLASTRHGDWLDRVVVHSLGVPSKALLAVTDRGLYVERTGAQDVFVPTSSLVGARLERGIAGAVYEGGGVVVVTWRLGDADIDTGFRATEPSRHGEVVAAVETLLGRGSDAHPVAPAPETTDQGGPQ